MAKKYLKKMAGWKDKKDEKIDGWLDGWKEL